MMIMEKTFEQAKAELIELAVGYNEYQSNETWEELAEGAAFEMVAANQRASSLSALVEKAEKIVGLLKLGEVVIAEKEFEKAKVELVEFAVGANEYQAITTWEELAEGAALETVAANKRAESLVVLLEKAEQQSEKEFHAEMTVTCGHFDK